MNQIPLFSHIRKTYFPTLAEQLGYSDRDILVIVNIDDVGLHRDETEASFRALKFGMVKSGSIMAPCPNFDQVMTLWKENPEADLGIHLTLTSEWGKTYPWAPVLPRTEVPSLYNAEGSMWSTDEEFLLHAQRKDIEKELEAQINKVLDRGLQPSHLDHHMNIHLHSEFLPVVIELSRKYMLPIHIPGRKRNKLPFMKNNLISLRRRGYVFPDTQKGTYKIGGHSLSPDFWEAKYHDHLRSLQPGVHIIKVHIAFRTKELQNITGMRDSSIRQIDYDVWTSDETRKLAEELGIVFTGYRPLQQLQEKLMEGRFAR